MRLMRTLAIGGLCSALMILSAVTAPAWGFEVKSAGALNVPADTPLFAVSTDPTIQHVLDQDFHAARRNESGASQSPVTVTVSMNQQLLMPGVSLTDLAPGDPTVVARLLKEAGEQPPPVGDTGDRPSNPYADNIVRQATRPDANPMMAQMREQQAMSQMARQASGPRFGPHGNAGPEQIYDTIIVARATASNSRDQMTVVAVVHAGDDVRTAKKLVAESIANAILH